jgi:type IX secretion system PorP/SprF family membrane protein
MNKTVHFLFGIFLLCFAQDTCAQTPYSSQNFNLNNFFNPATSGFGINNKIQTIFRTQYEGVGNAYRTIGLAADIALVGKNNYDKNNLFGMGVQAVSEQVLDGVLQTNAITLSLANRLFLNGLKTSSIALGISSTLITRTIDASKLTFGDQFNSGRLFNSSSLEVINTYPVKFSSNVGLLYTLSNEQTFFQFGGSLFYINRSSLEQAIEKFAQSYQTLAQINFEKRVWENNTIAFHADYQNRFENEFVYAGAVFSIPMNAKGENYDRFYIGCFYRTKDAIIPYVGLMYKKYKFGLSYDVYQSKMSLSSLRPQTIEFTISTNISHRASNKLVGLFN